MSLRSRTLACAAAAASFAGIGVQAADGERRAGDGYRAAIHLARDIGPRPAAGRAELRAHRYVAKRFRRAGLEVTYTPFRVPGRGASRNVVGSYDGPRRCLKIVMAHADSVAGSPGAVDNASGVGVVVALAARLRTIRARCDVWLVATGAEERPYTRHADHLGSRRLVRHLRRLRKAKRLRYALSVDMVGRGTRFQLRSPRARPRERVERELLRAGRRQRVRLRWLRDSATGNSDHREFELARLPALALQIWGGTEPCYHSACDSWRRIQPGALRRVQRVVEHVLRRP